jgi:hypothetical protein
MDRTGCHEWTNFVSRIRIDANIRLPLGQILGKHLARDRSAWIGLLAAVQMTPQPAWALDMQAQPRPLSIAPLPPERPAGIGSPAKVQPPPADSAVPEGAPMPPSDPPPQPRNLPPASRARMHECAVEWQKMKESGAAADKIWYDFAQNCLVK